VLRSSKPFEQGLRILPVAYGLTIAVNVMSIALDGPKCKYLQIKKTISVKMKKSYRDEYVQLFIFQC